MTALTQLEDSIAQEQEQQQQLMASHSRDVDDNASDHANLFARLGSLSRSRSSLGSLRLSRSYSYDNSNDVLADVANRSNGGGGHSLRTASGREAIMPVRGVLFVDAVAAASRDSLDLHSSSSREESSSSTMRGSDTRRQRSGSGRWLGSGGGSASIKRNSKTEAVEPTSSPLAVLSAVGITPHTEHPQIRPDASYLNIEIAIHAYNKPLSVKAAMK